MHRQFLEESPLPAYSTHRVAGFDGLRAVAVILVFFQHKISDRWQMGELGVKIFFVLSGFLIVGILHEQRLKIEDGSSVRSQWLTFWKRRALRIFPIYYLTLSVVGVLMAMKLLMPSGFASYWVFGSNFFLYFDALAAGAVQWSAAHHIAHFWTLGVEQQFYILASVLVLCTPSSRHVALMCGLIAMSLLSFAWQAVFDGGNHYNFLLPAQNLMYLAAGGFLRLRGAPKVGLAGVSAVAALTSVVLLHPMRDVIWLVIYVQPALGLLTAWCLVAHVVRFQSGVLVRWLELRPMVYLGTISYGFYVYHQLPPRLEYFAAAFDLDLASRAVRYVWAAWSFAATLLIAVASWHLLERPLLRLKNKRSKLAAV